MKYTIKNTAILAAFSLALVSTVEASNKDLASHLPANIPVMESPSPEARKTVETEKQYTPTQKAKIVDLKLDHNK
ncbi:hypothetical protein [Dyadobacter tibetensis]|uniref:hypothetical protein n=1 Tax=Dyadobacter tibetensis TaxID=1211851 RepID=UPI0004B754C7|nr:hypothetical protein [Dyadobacter tibetensis]